MNTRVHRFKRGEPATAAGISAEFKERMQRDLEARGIDLSKQSYKPVEPVYDCAICHDTGFVRAGDYETHEPLFGKLVPCSCKTGEKGPKQAADEYTNLFPRDLNLTWNEVKELNPLNTNISVAKGAVDQVLRRGYGWVYLYGGYGTAKTLILKTACAYAMRAGMFAAYARLQDIIDTVLAAYDQGQAAAVSQVNRWSMVDFLAVDELEKVSESGETIKRRFQIFDRRYAASCDGRYGISIMAGNVSPDELEPALASRIMDGRNFVVELTGEDARPYTKALDLDKR